MTLTPAAALAAVQSALAKLERAGVQVAATTRHEHGHPVTYIILTGVELREGHMVVKETTNDKSAN